MNRPVIEEFTLILKAELSDVPAITRIRALLKVATNELDLQCISIERTGDAPVMQCPRCDGKLKTYTETHSTCPHCQRLVRVKADKGN